MLFKNFKQVKGFFISQDNFITIITVLQKYFNKYNFPIRESEGNYIHKLMIEISEKNIPLQKNQSFNKYLMMLNREIVGLAKLIFIKEIKELQKQQKQSAVEKFTPVNKQDINNSYDKITEERSYNKPPEPKKNLIVPESVKTNNADVMRQMKEREDQMNEEKLKFEMGKNEAPKPINFNEIEPNLEDTNNCVEMQPESFQETKSNLFDNRQTQETTEFTEINNNILINKPAEFNDIMNDINKYKKFLKEEYISIDSRDRNTDIYPTTQDYVIVLDKEYKDIISVELISAVVSKTQYNINSSNNIIDFLEETGDITMQATISTGNYTISELLTEIISELNNISSIQGNTLTYTLTVNSKTNKIDITANDNFSLLFNGGTEIHNSGTRSIYPTNSIAPVIGFDRKDYIGTNTYSSPFMYNLDGEPYVFLYIKELENIEGSLNENGNSFTKLILDTEQNKSMYYGNNKDFISKKTFSPHFGSLNQLIIKFYNYNGDLYDFNGINNSLYFKITRLQYKNH